MNITQTITLDLSQVGVFTAVNAKQGDDRTRFVRAVILNGGMVWQAPEGTTAGFRCVKPDGHSCQNPAVINDDGTVTVELTAQVLAVPGTVWGDISFVGADGETLSTASFAIYVAGVPQGQNIPSSNEFLTLVDMVSRGEKLLKDLNQGTGGLEDLRKRVEELEYKPMDVLSISNSIGTKELGSQVSGTVSWSLNKNPAGQTLNGESLAADARSREVGPVTQTTTWSLRAEDERGTADSGSTIAYFHNGVYYGALTPGTAVDSAAILGLTRKLQSGKGVTFTAGGDGKRPVYACPVRYGEPTFVIGGLTYDWQKIGPLDFTNRSGYTEPYYVWMHGKDVESPVAVTVS